MAAPGANTAQPRSIGASISSTSTDTLALEGVGGLTLGSWAFVVEDGEYYNLEPSTEDLGPGVVAVLGVAGLRWILSAPGGGNLTTSALPDADDTVTVATSSEFTLAVGLLTAGRVLTLATAGSTTGEVIRVVRNDVSAHTYTVIDDTLATLYVFPASIARKADFRFDGAHYQLSGHAAIQ